MNGLMVKIRTDTFEISKFILALLVISINIREPFFHTREILYVLLMITSISYMDFSKAKYALILLVIWLVSYCYNMIIPGSTITIRDGGLQPLILSAYLLLLCFCQERYSKAIISSYNFVSIVVALITISVWLVCFFSNATFWRLRSFFLDFKENSGLTLMSLDYRMILGTRYLTVWYRTAPCMVCTLGYFLIQRLRGLNKHTVSIVLLAAALIMSGTRANILATFLLLSFYIVYYLKRKGLQLFVIILFCAALFVAVAFVLKFLNDADSQSSAIKILDSKTYYDIFKSDFFRTLFFGWGCGSTFFSQGRQNVVTVTELTLLETIRRYGLISAYIIFWKIWFKPLKGEIYRGHTNYKSFYLFVFLAYFFIGLTNPYLLDSVGFCALLFYCVWFCYDKDIKRQFRGFEHDFP